MNIIKSEEVCFSFQGLLTLHCRFATCHTSFVVYIKICWSTSKNRPNNTHIPYLKCYIDAFSELLAFKHRILSQSM